MSARAGIAWQGTSVAVVCICCASIFWTGCAAGGGVEVHVRRNGAPLSEDAKTLFVSSMEGLRAQVETSGIEGLGHAWWLADQDGLKVSIWEEVRALPQELRHLSVVPEGRLFQWAPRRVGERFAVKMKSLAGVEMETVATSPRLFLIHNLFTEDEAARLIDRALNRTGENELKSSGTGFDTSGKRTQFEKRTSANAWDSESAVSQDLIWRCFEALRVPYSKPLSDGLQILRYEAGQAYVAHTDWFPSATAPAGYNWDPSTPGGSNRYATVFLYLRPPPSGGYTFFPDASAEATPGEQDSAAVSRGRDAEARTRAIAEAEAFYEPGAWELDLVRQCHSSLAVKPVRYGAALFYHQEPMTGKLIKEALHGACPSLTGAKWGANLWIWNQARHLTRPAAGSGSQPSQVSGTFVNRGEVDVELEYSSDGVSWKQFWPMPAKTYFNAKTYPGHSWRMVTSAAKQQLQTWKVPKGVSTFTAASDGTQGDVASPADGMRYATKSERSDL